MSLGAQQAVSAERFKAFVLEDSFPCLGARSAINTGRAHMQSYGRLGDEATPQLQALHRCDQRDFDWAQGVSSDPASSDFSFSIGGRAFFVVGLHPHASRLSRRSPAPCIAFNFHDQFEQLRASGKYDTMQRAIRARDVALQGDVNPVLSRFGESSEARQYSGRAVGANWGCPFRSGVAHGR